MLPSVPDLEVAEPGRAVKCTLFLFVVEGVDLIPARIPVRLQLDALVGQVVEI